MIEWLDANDHQREKIVILSVDYIILKPLKELCLKIK